MLIAEIDDSFLFLGRANFERGFLDLVGVFGVHGGGSLLIIRFYDFSSLFAWRLENEAGRLVNP
ncbi:MAG: hypothetical protein ACXW32_06830 [Limisphaerales bacterium]